MAIVEIRGVALGSGLPKVIVPLCETTPGALLQQAKALAESDADLVEWRVDALGSARDSSVILALLPDIRAALGEKPLLATCRTVRDGGAGTSEPDAYCALCRALCESGQIDLIDIELSAGIEAVHTLIAAAHTNHVSCIVSSHDFSATPAQQAMVDRMRRMQALGADIAKLAVMPRDRGDVAALLAATAEMADHHTETPVITVSMGKLGVISRVACEAFGSAATFASTGHASAPGQPSLEQTCAGLSCLHSIL
jgi:3-dehydroquinate dehydratase-1